MAKLIFSILVMVSLSSYAQSGVKIPSDPDSSGVSFGDGILFTHEPSNVKLKMKMRVQGRATYTDYDADNLTVTDETGLEVRRARLSFEGTAVEPQLFFKVQLAFTRGDLDWDTNGYPNILRDAIVGWKFSDKHNIYFGQAKLPGNRQNLVSSSRLELVDRSLLNSTFSFDRDIGLQTWSQFGDSSPIILRLAVANGEGRASDNGDTGMAYVSRLEWQPLGAFTNEGDYSEGDLEFETTPKLALGTSYMMNRRAHRVGGQTGKYIASGDSRDIEAFFGDILFKYRGWAVQSEYARRNTDIPILDATQFVLVGDSVMAQASYTFTNYYAPVVRWTKLWPDEDIYSRTDIKTQYTVGLTKYFNRHKVKLQGDITMEEIDKPITQVEQQNFIVRLQVEVGI